MVRARVEAGDDLAGGDSARYEREFMFSGGGNAARANPRGYTESCSGSDGCSDRVGCQKSSCAEEEAGELRCDCSDGVGGCGCSERDLQDRKTRFGQRPCQWHGVSCVLDLHYRDDAECLHFSEYVRAHQQASIR
jgi:hypothetical protein